MSAPGAGAPPPPAPPALPALNLTAEVPIFVGVLVLYALWLNWYFSHHHSQTPVLSRSVSKLWMRKRADLWTTAKDTRTAWAEEMMADPKEGKVVADSMRNTIMGATVLVMGERLVGWFWILGFVYFLFSTVQSPLTAGVSQIMARLIQVWYDAASLDQIAAMTLSDPIAPRSFASPAIRVGLAIMTLQVRGQPTPSSDRSIEPQTHRPRLTNGQTSLHKLALAAFANAARLAIHLTFMLRVVAGGADVGCGAPLRREAIAVVHRVSLYFSVG